MNNLLSSGLSPNRLLKDQFVNDGFQNYMPSVSSRENSIERVNEIINDDETSDDGSGDEKNYKARSSRSRRDMYELSKGSLPCPCSERRPSLERAGSYTVSYERNERRPSLERYGRQGKESERRPSLERLDQVRFERPPSLERSINSVLDHSERLQRCPSLERAERLQRRPSLERAERLQRRPSLERAERLQSRPSLERGAQQRRPSLERPNYSGVGAATSLWADGDGPSQGINTLRPWPLNHLGVPQNWDMNRIPQHNSGLLYELVPIPPGDREYSAITVDFEEAGMRAITVERLQNHMLLDRFKTEKEHLQKLRHADFELNERYLYHGTRASMQRLCEEGLDSRLSFQGCFGRGIYFSDNPRKCVQYANTLSDKQYPMILVCRVILGEAKKYSSGHKEPDLKREPEKEVATHGWRYYDSVQGTPVDYPEFVVYENRRAMIEYIITFEEVAYRAPSSLLNSGDAQSLASPLYKVEPVELPIPEEELDRLYMLYPDTDSDGSCDEHTREVERLRESVRKTKAKKLGIAWRPPTEEEKRYERLHWKRVCYYSCPPNTPLFDLMIMKKKEDRKNRKERKRQEREKQQENAQRKTALPKMAASGKEDGSKLLDFGSLDEISVSDESVAQVLSCLIADFLQITEGDNVAQARQYILDADMDLDKALAQYFTET